MIKENIMEYPYTDDEGRTWINEFEWVDHDEERYNAGEYEPADMWGQ